MTDFDDAFNKSQQYLMDTLSRNNASLQAEGAGRPFQEARPKTLRDEFAMAALPACYLGYVDHAKNHGWDEDWKMAIAVDSYQIADAMLKAREATK